MLMLLKCCFTSTETVGLLGTGAQDVHLDFHTAPELCGRCLSTELFNSVFITPFDRLSAPGYLSLCNMTKL